MQVNADTMFAGAHGGFMAATDLADYLVGTGMPFRDAHEVVGRLVLECEKSGRTLQELTAEQFAAADEAFAPDVLDAVDIRSVVARRVSEGGTGQDAVMNQLERAAGTLQADVAWVEALRD